MQFKQIELHLASPYESVFSNSHSIGGTSFSKTHHFHLNHYQAHHESSHQSIIKQQFQ